MAGRGVLAGCSAAEIMGASCGPDDAPAEVALPTGCLLRQPGLRVHRGLLLPDEVTTVGGIGVTTRLRTAYDRTRLAPSLVEAVVAVDALAVPEPSRSLVGIEYDGGEHLTPERARRDLERQHRLSQLGWVLVRPRAAVVFNRPALVAIDVRRELDWAAERLGLPKITVSGGAGGEHRR